jgi:ribosomal-protein-alanine N-acetyltransferase
MLNFRSFHPSGLILMPAFDDVRLASSRLLLRPLLDEDALSLFQIFSDPRIMQFWSSPPWASVADAEAKISRNRAGMAAGTSLDFGIFALEDERLLGTCDLFHLDQQCRRGEVGYGLAFDAWGQGYMQESMLALLDYGFKELQLNRIEADIDPGNEASAKLLTRMGFQLEGLLRERWIVGGEKSDSAMYGLLLSEWQSRQKQA